MTWLYFVFVQSVFVFVGQTLTMVALIARARPTVSVRIRYKNIFDSAQTTGITISPSVNAFRLTDAALSLKNFNIMVGKYLSNRSTYQVKPFYLSSETVLPIT
jgi:hypothetical protein